MQNVTRTPSPGQFGAPTYLSPGAPACAWMAGARQIQNFYKRGISWGIWLVPKLGTRRTLTNVPPLKWRKNEIFAWFGAFLLPEAPTQIQVPYLYKNGGGGAHLALEWHPSCHDLPLSFLFLVLSFSFSLSFPLFFSLLYFPFFFFFPFPFSSSLVTKGPQSPPEYAPDRQLKGCKNSGKQWACFYRLIGNRYLSANLIPLSQR